MGVATAMDLDVEALKAKLAALKLEHRDLDEGIARLAREAPFDQLRLQRLKKRKLLLKDQISKIESELLPDIIA
jgi:hypothetical protein